MPGAFLLLLCIGRYKSLHDGPAFRDHASSYGCMWIEPDDGPLAVVGGSAWGNVQVMVPGAGLFWIRQ